MMQNISVHSLTVCLNILSVISVLCHMSQEWLKSILAFSSLNVSCDITVTPALDVIKVIWKSHGGVLVPWTIWSHNHAALLWPQKYVSGVETGGPWVSHFPSHKIVMFDVKGCHVTDTVSRAMLQQELRHRQLTVTLGSG